jgi:hypothetical protein
MSDEGWFAAHGEVLKRERDGTIWHVTERYESVDDETRKYRLEDHTHTLQEHWYGEDLRDCFERIDVIMPTLVKPKHRLDGRLYDD